jgi:TIR domain
MKKKVFISYAHEDAEHLERFRKGLNQLKDVFDFWYDEMIKPGEQWQSEILKNLEEADFVIFLVSDSFLDSRFISQNELQKTFIRYEEGKVEIFPVLVRYCANWSDYELNLPKTGGSDQIRRITKLGDLQYVPTDPGNKKLTPVNSWQDKDRAWEVVINEFKRLVNTPNPQ